ncbi:MAG: SusC/RagA family TonB-linked outer membrane protein [Longimicrobiales bacterium]
MKRFVFPAVAVLAAVTSAPGGAQSNQASGADARAVSSPPAVVGTIVGTVTEAGTTRPLASVQMSIEGRNLGALSDAQGRYTIQNVPAGEVRLVATRIGYAQAARTVTVRDGATATADVQMTETAVLLDEVVVTGTAGGTQRRAIGNVVATVSADAVMARSPVGSVDQLLAQRTPGLMMLPGTGQVGTGSAIRIRGNSSLSLGNEPIIYIDGVRMDSNTGRGPGQRGGANVSRLNDINPADIQSVEIIKGPAAATLYGTEASNGVIQIITKRGVSGAPQFDVSARVGTNWLWNPAGRTGMRWCRITEPACTGRTSNSPEGLLFGFNAYEEEAKNGTGPIFGYGTLQNYTVSMRGGTDAVRYFASASRDDDMGVVDWNWDKRMALRANMEMLLSNAVTVGVNTSYIRGETRLAQGSIETDPFSNLIWSNPRNLGTPTRGFLSAPPEEWSEVEGRADNDRTTTSVEIRYQPVSWFKNRLVAGIDLNNESNWTLFPQQPEGASHFFGQNGLGNKQVSRGNRRFVTVDYSGSAEMNWREFSLQPSVGFQFYKSESNFINSSGQNFPAVPVTTVSGGSIRDGGETFVENATVGVYVQQQVGWRNRVFVTGAVRGDDNSAFGAEYDAAIYPKLSATWVLHEEPFFTFDFIDQLRLRTAWGVAGQQPGTFDASRLYSPQIGYRDQPSLVPGQYGNPQLKPERSKELELGFDATLLKGRLDLVYTRYQRNVVDAIVNKPLAPSSGFTGSQIVNIGELKAWGNEVGVIARLMQSDRFGWEVDAQYATMRNEIVDLGGLAFISGNGQSQHREGYSIGDFFMRRIRSAEINAQGQVLSSLCDGGTGPDRINPGGELVPCAQAPRVWWGRTQPTWTIGLGNTFTLFNNVRLYARVEGNGGHLQANTEIRATHNQVTSKAVLLGNDPILQATRVLENDATGTYRAGFIRLREITSSYDLPAFLTHRIGAKSGALSIGMRNVAMLWTAEHGWDTPRDGSVHVSVAGRTMITWDPEVRATGQASTGYQTVLPPTASVTMSLRLSF